MNTEENLWAQYACAALIGEMASISLHDQPHLWRPKQAEQSAAMADAMLEQHRKRFPSGANTQMSREASDRKGLGP